MSAPVVSTEQAVVYGTDDRLEFYESPSEALRVFAAHSAVALVGDDFLNPEALPLPERLWTTKTLRERLHLCPGSRFAEQPSAAECTGVLVDSDLVLTAGHCLRDLDCATLHVVFGFYFDAPDVPHATTSDDFYRCREILMYEVASERHLDYGFMRLDRHAAAHRAVRLPLTAEPLGTGSRIAAVEAGTGLPLKLQVGATVVDGRAETLDYFATNLDMFVGSSGAAVLDSAGALRGVYATGSNDFSYMGECHEYVHLPASEGNERVTYAFQALAGLCEQRPGASSQCSEARSRRADSGCAMRSERIPQSSANRRLVALVALSFIVAAQRRSRRAGHRAGRAPCNRALTRSSVVPC